MSSYYEGETLEVEIGCNCKGGLKRTLLRNKIPTINYLNGSHFDLINASNSLIRMRNLESWDAT